MPKQDTLEEKDKQNIYEALMKLKYPEDRPAPCLQQAGACISGECAGDEDGPGGLKKVLRNSR